jgi:uncharacterized membrane protein
MIMSAADRLRDAIPADVAGAPAPVRWVHALERTASLDRFDGLLRAASAPLGRGSLGRLLTGGPVGHAVHPPMTDLPIGLWTSSVLLDLVGRERDQRAADLLLAAGLVSAVPTALTGLAEWRHTARPESRVAAAHGVLNGVALGLYAASLAVRPGSRGAGLALSLAATGVLGLSGYLGGHLATARKTGSRHPAYVDDGVGPRLSRTAAQEG